MNECHLLNGKAESEDDQKLRVPKVMEASTIPRDIRVYTEKSRYIVLHLAAKPSLIEGENSHMKNVAESDPLRQETPKSGGSTAELPKETYQ